MDTPIVRHPGQPDNGNPANVTHAETPCPVCGCERVALTWHPFGHGKRHIRVTCAACNKWLRWAIQTDVTVALADAAPSTD